MTNAKLQALETLLSELRAEIGAPFIVIPEFLHDGIFFAVYDSEGNAPVYTTSSHDLESCLAQWQRGEKNTLKL
ncbi:MAG: hypothetical protein E6Q97_13195 [Desulfurellales bacterium]|nr:MAG: hypothetical protein E6Q97_13195 [Desulfurellales bacterium]